MASLARHLTLRSRPATVSRAYTSRLPPNARRALARYYSSDNQPSPTQRTNGRSRANSRLRARSVAAKSADVPRTQAREGAAGAGGAEDATAAAPEEDNGVDFTEGRFPRNLPFPDLSQPLPLYDMKKKFEFKPSDRDPYGSTVEVYNSSSIFEAMSEVDRLESSPDELDPQLELLREIKLREREKWRAEDMDKMSEKEEREEEEEEEELWEEEGDNSTATRKTLPMTTRDYGQMHVYQLMRRRVVQQTPKGKIPRMASLVVVGNGKGLVGWGYAKASGEAVGSGYDRALIKAVRSMDYVDRFEDRTVWTEREGKLGATRIIMRPRPAGFGLRCNPYIHQICKAAGIQDISAKVWGSRTPINVIQLTFRMLWSGNAPHFMGNGLGGGGRKLDKGSGMRGVADVQRERGRKMIDLRLR